jgi:quercetin dioxygenase-like cupin family protein
MEIETLKVNLTTTKNSRLSGCALSGFNLPSLIATMKQSCTWANGELNAVILLNSPHRQIILTALHEGTEVKFFQSNDSVTFQIIEGKLKFHIRGDTVTLNEGQRITLDEKIKYRFTTREKTVFLLTISNGIRNTSDN